MIQFILGVFVGVIVTIVAVAGLLMGYQKKYIEFERRKV